MNEIDHGNDNLVTFGAIAAILLPLIGVACAIALMARHDPRGGTVFVLSTVMFFVWPVALFLIAV
jgi:hypothetical protein